MLLILMYSSRGTSESFIGGGSAQRFKPLPLDNFFLTPDVNTASLLKSVSPHTYRYRKIYYISHAGKTITNNVI